MSMLQGLRLGPPQTLGAIRIIPVLRDVATVDLRLAQRSIDALGVVSVDHRAKDDPGIKYVAFVPHAFVVSHTSDGSPVATLGAQFGLPKGEQKGHAVKLMHRMVKRLDDEDGTSRVRMLPLHLAMEGFLALHFRGPDILWKEYSAATKRFGLDPRTERVARGSWLPGLEEALRIFELAERQVGMLLYVQEAFASAFVMPHPDDYRAAHRSVLEDFLGETLVQFGILHPEAPSAWAHLDTDGAETLEDLARAIEDVRERWRDYATTLAGALLERDPDVELVRTMGRFRLERFLPKFDLEEESHVGERIVAEDGSVQYLKTFRLSTAQVRRAYLMKRLAEGEWRLEATAKRMNVPLAQLADRVIAAGLGYMFTPFALAEARKQPVA